MPQPFCIETHAAAKSAARRALVTGGSLGVGAAIVRALARGGTDVAIHHSSAVDRAMGHPEAGARLHAEARALGVHATLIDLDFTQPGAGARTAERALEQWDAVDWLFVCASVQKREPMAGLTHEEAMRQFNVNFWSTIELLQSLHGPMRRQRYGRIVSLGSINQERPSPDLAVYAALKAAQHNLMRNLARVWVDDGITLNTLSPGLVHTPRSDWRRQEPGHWDAFAHAANPMHRAASAEEIASLAVMLVCDASAFMTGANIMVDGGAHL
jgi:NAD(P)-dependent dehydrogenase (short-subunit alcohol dehydrogenase family)